MTAYENKVVVSSAGIMCSFESTATGKIMGQQFLVERIEHDKEKGEIMLFGRNEDETTLCGIRIPVDMIVSMQNMITDGADALELDHLLSDKEMH